MPLITLTLLEGRTTEEKHAILNQVHECIVTKAGTPEHDRFQRVIELNKDNFVYDSFYPELKTSRTESFMIIEILFSVGRSVKVKKMLLADLMARLDGINVSPNDVMVCFQETAWENWAFANGIQPHV
ncbi:tautomerase family protein [Mucilaginibacter phyllosphaerae]